MSESAKEAILEAARRTAQAHGYGGLISWLTKMLAAATSRPVRECETRARAIFAAVAGAQLMARSRADLHLFDSLIASFRESGLIPT